MEKPGRLRTFLMVLVLALASPVSLRPTAYAQSRQEGQSALSAAHYKVSETL